MEFRSDKARLVFRRALLQTRRATGVFTAGYGYLKSPEELHPDEPMHRITASVLHGRSIGADGQAASAVVWGVNRHGDDSKPTHSFLVENETIVDRKNTVFGRAELIQKTGEDLVLGENAQPDEALSSRRCPAGIYPRARAPPVGNDWFWRGRDAEFRAEVARRMYGSRNPVGTFLFLRFVHSTLERARCSR